MYFSCLGNQFYCLHMNWSFSPWVGGPEVYSHHRPNTLPLIIIFGEHTAGHQQTQAKQAHSGSDPDSIFTSSWREYIKHECQRSGQAQNTVNVTHRLEMWPIIFFSSFFKIKHNIFMQKLNILSTNILTQNGMNWCTEFSCSSNESNERTLKP